MNAALLAVAAAVTLFIAACVVGVVRDHMDAKVLRAAPRPRKPEPCHHAADTWDTGFDEGFVCGYDEGVRDGVRDALDAFARRIEHDFPEPTNEPATST